jgi:hypothetical protein
MLQGRIESVMNSFSVSIAWRNRPELARTLEANAELFERHCDEVTIVNCGGDPDEMSRLARACRVAGLRQVHVPDTPFNKSLANNVGAIYSSRPFVFFLDTDIILESDVFAAALRILERGDAVVKVRTVHESQPMVRETLKTIKEIATTARIVFTNGRAVYTRTFIGGDGSRCGPGLLLLKREHLMAVGGFNSSLEGWGFDDIDLQFRLQLALGLKLRAVGRVLHLSHGDERRNVVTGSLKNDQRRNMVICADNYSRHDYMGTCERDRQMWRDKIRLIPLDGHVVPSIA